MKTDTLESVFALAALSAGMLVGGAAVAQENRSAFIDSIAVGQVWRDVTASEGNHLKVDQEVVAYSGGGTANGRTVVFGGGHNNGMSDSVAILDWRNFETVGWTEELESTADHIGVADNDYSAIGSYLNAHYDGSTPGGISDDRGLVALSRHTYDDIAVGSDHFYMFGGPLPFSNSGQPSAPWRNAEGDIWRYDFGVGWTYIGNPLPRYIADSAAAYDTLTGNIWVHDDNGLRLFNTTTETMGPAGPYLDSQAIESSLNFNPDKGAQGTLFGSGRYAGSNWHEYDIATGQQRNMGPVPGNNTNTYIIYVPASYGGNYGTYFAIVPQDGTLRRWNGSGWDTIATGGPSNNDYVYGRAGFEEVHQVFYWVHNGYSGSNGWKTLIVRPYPFNGSAKPAPTVSLSADPAVVPDMGSSTLSWMTTNATSCTASGAWSGSRPVSGNESTGSLSASRTYSLTCSGEGGTAADSVTVTVQGVEPAPEVNIGANPLTIDEGGSTVVDWTSVNATTCEALGDWSGARDTQGSEAVGPLNADVVFMMTCTGPGGDASDSVAVTVTPAGSGTPPPPPPPPEENISVGAFGLPGLFLLFFGVIVRRRLIIK